MINIHFFMVIYQIINRFFLFLNRHFKKKIPISPEQILTITTLIRRIQVQTVKTQLFSTYRLVLSFVMTITLRSS